MEQRTSFSKRIFSIMLSLMMVLSLLYLPSGVFGIDLGLKASAEGESSATGVTFEAIAGEPAGFNNEGYANLLDNDTSTKWCCGFETSAYVVIKASERIRVSGYTLTTGNDTGSNSDRNPQTWTLSASNDNATWVEIDTIEDGEMPAEDIKAVPFSITETTEYYQYFKLNITQIVGGDIMQISEFALTYTTCEHQWERTDRTIDPTCTEGGYDIYECSICGFEKKEPNGESAIEHIKGEDGKCSSCGAYMISNAAELKTFAAAVNGGEVSANAILTAKITVNNAVFDENGNLNDGLESWTPIGNSGVLYTGTFDGQGHTISGLYCNNTESSFVGLFGCVGEGGAVLSVGVADSYFNGAQYVGGVCGGSLGTIENCYNSGTVGGNQYVGGVCGYNYCKITNCYNSGTVSGNQYVGGVCGYNYGTITNCYNSGTFSGSYDIGGVYGYNDGGAITNCYYLSKTAGLETKTEAQFKSGAVAYLLSQGCEVDGETYDGSIWGQKIGTDDFPVPGGAKVYATTGCVTYNNTGDTSEKAHDDNYNSGRCTVCGKYKEPDKDENGVYQISKVTDLYWLADTVNSGNGSINAVLKNDITVNAGVLKDDGTLADDASGFLAWTPIGYYNSDSDCSYYTGTFDGQGHTISGLYFNDTSVYNIGLFGCVGQSGSVSNVGVVDSYFKCAGYVGGVCGYNAGTINGCYAICSVDDIYNYCVGGVCGCNEGIITNCFSKNTVSDKKAAIGGDYGDSTNVSAKSTAQFASGEVAYLLNGATSEGSLVWGQTLSGASADAYPKAHTDTNTVYATTGCVTYNNTGDTSENAHDDSYNSGRCTVCGKYKEAEKDENGVYQISKVTDLYWFADAVNSGNGSINAVLKNDITVNEGVLKNDGTLADDVSGFIDWTPIGYYNSDSDNIPYTGTFDGQGYTISGLYFNDTSAYSIGLFGSVGEQGSVSNVGVADSYIKGAQYVGGVCGENEGTITNCYNSGTISGDERIGGVCGMNWSTIEGCYNTGAVSGDANVGGVCGENVGTITNCNNTGSVSGTRRVVGGICGLNNGTIKSCYNTGTVGGTSDAVGGVCGLNWSTIKSCYNTGAVNGNESVGGVCGGSWSIISNCYNTAAVSGNESVGGVCGYCDYGTIENCYNSAVVSGDANVGGVCGENNSKGKITNCYFDSDVYNGNNVGYNNRGTVSDSVLGKTTDEFKSGEVCYLLNGGLIDSPVWYQNVDKGTADTYPALDSTHGIVYKSPCTASDTKYSNEDVGHTVSGDYNNGFGVCSVCGADICESATKSENGVYEISNAGQLYWFVQAVNSGRASINAVLKNDITVNAGALKDDGTLADDVSEFMAWTPIGNSEVNYIGTFDGQGHTISGLYFNDTDASYVGLFGYVGENGSISNVSVVDSYFNGANNVGGVCGYNKGTIENGSNAGSANGTDYVGGVCGYNDGTTESCNNTGTVNGANNVGGVCGYNKGTIENGSNAGSANGTDYVGGVCGYNGEGTINNCSNTGTVIGNGNYVGGVSGYNWSDTSTITNSNNEGTVNGVNYVGGVCGYNDYGEVTNCNNTGNVSGTGSDIGGVCGFNWRGTVTNCHNTGMISGTVTGSNGHICVGGVCGNNESTIENCYNSGKVTAANQYSFVGGVCGLNHNGKITNCYNAGDISGLAYIGGVCGNNWSGTIANCYSIGTTGGTSYALGVCGTEYSGSIIENCYYLAETEDENGGKTASQFNSGEVAYLLSQGCTIGEGEGAVTYDGSIWGQNIDNGKPTELYPALSGEKVYNAPVYDGCEGIPGESTGYKYSNKEAVYVDHTDNNNDCICDNCGNVVESSLKVSATMVKGAALRLTKGNGLRFYTLVDSAKIAELQALGATVELGTLIAPKDLLDGKDLTFDMDESKYINVKYEAIENGAYYWHKDVDGQIAGSIVNIKESNTSYSAANGNIARDFVGRGYVKVTLNGTTVITYADYVDGDAANNTRSLAYVANALKNDTAKYGELDNATKALVDKWSSKLTK